MLTYFQKFSDYLIPPVGTHTSPEEHRKVRMAVQYSLTIQIVVGIYLCVDTFILGRMPQWRMLSIAMLMLNFFGLVFARIFKKAEWVQIGTPLSFLGLVTVGALNNGGIFGPIPSCFALSIMVTIAIATPQVAKFFVFVNLAILVFLASVAKSSLVGPMSSSVYTYVMVNLTTLLTTYWFFSMYEREQERLRVVVHENQRLQTIAKMIATLNHEINTPLNSTLLALQMLGDLDRQNINQEGAGISPSPAPKPETPGNHLHEISTANLVDNALLGLKQIQGVVQEISAMKPEELVEDDYHAKTPTLIGAKIYKVASQTPHPDTQVKK